MIFNRAPHTGKKGFTIIETLIAILILTVAIAGPLTIAAKGLSAALIAKDQTTAFYLAQDGMEFVRAARDNACLATSGSCTGVVPTIFSAAYCGSASGCTVNSMSATNSASACSGACPPLKFDASTNLFGYSSGSNSIFTRTVTVIAVAGATDEYQVTVTVTWNDVSKAVHQVVIRDNLYIWQ